MIEAVCGETMVRCGYPLELPALRRRVGGGIARTLIGANQLESSARDLVRGALPVRCA